MGDAAGLPFHSFSAVTSGLKELRQHLLQAEQERALSGKASILFVDEIHRFNKAQQDAFLSPCGIRSHCFDRGHHPKPVVRGDSTTHFKDAGPGSESINN